MPEESVVEEVQPTEETSTYDLDGFNFAEHIHVVPTEVHTLLVEKLSHQAYGWKSLARKVLRISRLSEELQEEKDALVEMATGVRTRKRNPLADARSALRRFITALDENKLEELAFEKSVSYTSFMKGEKPDKLGLIEAIIDEMIVGLQD